uniref:Homeobox domain-containing protein n=1 Tax=Neogobius melanostomus TaxID=47308 RepID=A0A8C6WID0_9GOBI
MYPITHPKSAESPTATTPSTAQSTNEESETITDGTQTIPCAQTQSPAVSEPTNQTSTSPDAKPTATASPPLSPKEPALSLQEEAPSSSPSGTSQSSTQINKMSATSGLPHKVIKHWFRNTLFKERQRDKDSPYNFNNPPTIALEESREEDTQSQSLTISPSSMSPALTSASSQPQPVELQRELHRGRRSSRTRFTEQQLETLQGVFEATPYPREEEYERLSALLSLPNRVIVVWFQNARQRARKSQDRGNEGALGGESKSHSDNLAHRSPAPLQALLTQSTKSSLLDPQCHLSPLQLISTT